MGHSAHFCFWWPKWVTETSNPIPCIRLSPRLLPHCLLSPSLPPHSRFSLQVLYIQAFVLVFLLGKFMGKVFFGQLRAAEMEVRDAGNGWNSVLGMGGCGAFGGVFDAI